MRTTQKLPNEKRKRLERTPERDLRLANHLNTILTDAISVAQPYYDEIEDCLRMYEQEPEVKVINTPIENAPNIEVGIGAIAADAMYAQLIDLVFASNPVLSCKASRPEFEEDARALQDFINNRALIEWHLRQASEHAALDDVKVGTFYYYIPWIARSKKTDINRITDVGPRIIPIPPEDVILPPGLLLDMNDAEWVAVRQYPRRIQLEERIKRENDKAPGTWTAEGLTPLTASNRVRQRRELFGRTAGERSESEHYETFDFYISFDYDEDGEQEDLYVLYEMSGNVVIHARYNPYDALPLCRGVFQLREHSPYGLGVLKMIAPYEREVTTIHNQRTLNSILANTRMWKGPAGSEPPSGVLRVFPNKYITESTAGSFQELRLSDVYPSAYQNEQATLSLAERRVGLNELNSPRPSQLLGGRTPGITTISMLQQVNRRFTPAFDGFRHNTGEAVKQCLWRYREQLLAGDKAAEENILAALGPTRGVRVIELLKSDQFEEGFSIEFTATSVSANKAQERQEAVLLLNTLSGYLDKVMNLVQIASAGDQLPKSVREAAMTVARIASDAIRRTVTTFEGVRDPDKFVVDIDKLIDENVEAAQVPQTGLDGLGQLLGAIVPQVLGGGPPQNGQPQ